MKIAFTGHRDSLCDVAELEQLWAEFPSSVWFTGGAIGFDRQVEAFCASRGIPNTIIKPDYARFGKGAPLRRNLELIAGADLVCACYDGRKTGGTFFTVSKSRVASIPVRVFHLARSTPLKDTGRLSPAASL